MQYSESPRPKQGGKSGKQVPNLAAREVLRRRKLHAVLPDARRFLDAVVDDRCRVMMTDAAAPIIARTVAEIAILDRETDASDDKVLITYSRLIAQALGLEDDPCRAIKLWLDAATVPLEQFGIAWAQHLERANRNSESRHVHQKLVDLKHLSIALNATRARVLQILGVPKCEIPFRKVRERRVTPEVARELRALAKRYGITFERIVDQKVTMTPEEFGAMIEKREAKLLPPERIEHYRIADESDLAVTKMVLSPAPWAREHVQARKPGPKPKRETLKKQIKAVADRNRVSVRTIERWARSLKSRFSTDELPSEAPRQINGATISNAYLLYLADNPLYDDGRKRRPPHIDLIIQHQIATGKGEPSPALIRQWKQRKKLGKMVQAAKAWASENEIQAEDQAAADTYASVFNHSRKGTVSDERATARPVRTPEGVLERGLPPAEAPGPESGDFDVGF